MKFSCGKKGKNLTDGKCPTNFSLLLIAGRQQTEVCWTGSQNILVKSNFVRIRAWTNSKLSKFCAEKSNKLQFVAYLRGKQQTEVCWTSL